MHFLHPPLAVRMFFPVFVRIVLFCFDIFVVFLLSSVPSDLFPQVVLFVLFVLLFFFSSQNIPAFFLCPIIFASPRFFIQVLSFCSCCQGEHRFYHSLILPLHRLVHLIPLCCSLRHVSIIRLFFQYQL